MAPFQSVQKDDLVISDPTMAVIGMEIQAVAYNTKKLKEADLPKSWEDLGSPRFKGILALDDPQRNGPLTIQLAILKGTWKNDAKWTGFLKGLKSLNVPVHRSTGAMFRQMVAGEFSLTEPALMQDVVTEMEKGSPVNYVKSIPPVSFPDYMVLYAKAPHPNTAKLFIEWVLSPAGQIAYAATGDTEPPGVRCQGPPSTGCSSSGTEPCRADRPGVREGSESVDDEADLGGEVTTSGMRLQRACVSYRRLEIPRASGRCPERGPRQPHGVKRRAPPCGSYDLLIRGERSTRTGISWMRTWGCRTGRSRHRGQPLPPAAKVIVARGMDVLPGLIDTHVHMREPGFTHKEDITSIHQAARRAGSPLPSTCPT